MTSSLSFTPVTTVSTTQPKPAGVLIGNSPVTTFLRVNEGKPMSGNSRFLSLEVKSSGNNPSTKSASLMCSDCDGNGAVPCNQCKGTGVNSKDHFNGQAKEGGLCWLCRGKKEMLCGSCNGAGFCGGFMSTTDQ